VAAANEALAAPDLVVFDIDGTLHDTFAWWPRVLRRGLAGFAAPAGLQLSMPDDAAACAVVGEADAGVWAPFLPASHQHRWRELRAVVLPLELEELTSGADHLFTGVRALLVHLRGLGVRLALASNCHREYLEAFCEGQGVAALTDWQFCLDSPGCPTKADMLRAATAAAGSRRAVMVGDRDNDLQAARAAGLPFVWRFNDRCAPAPVDAVWHGEPAELLGQLGLPRIS